MTVSPDPVHPAPLVRVARPRRRIVHRILRNLPWLTAVGAVAMTLEAARGGPDCRALARTAPSGVAIRVCEREYDRTRDPTTGARLADAHRAAGDLTAASAIARGLLATPARGDALHVLGEVALDEHQLAAARTAFEGARALHRLDGQGAEFARDDAAIARVERALSQGVTAAP